MKTNRLLLAIVLCWSAAGAAFGADGPNLVVNGGFEQNGGLATNTFTGWTVFDQSGSSGSWYAQMGTKPLPQMQNCTDFSVSEPPSGFAAMTTQSQRGSHILYQDVAIPSGANSVTLSFDLYLNSSALFAVQPNLGYVIRPNQQFRVDIMDPAAPVMDTGTGVLAALCQTVAADAPVHDAYSRHRYDLSQFAGRPARLRLADAHHG